MEIGAKDFMNIIRDYKKASGRCAGAFLISFFFSFVFSECSDIKIEFVGSLYTGMANFVLIIS